MLKLPTIASVLAAAFQGLAASGTVVVVPRDGVTLRINTYSRNQGCHADSYAGTLSSVKTLGDHYQTFDYNGTYLGAINVVRLSTNSLNVVQADGRTVWDGCRDPVWPDPKACTPIDSNVRTISLSSSHCR